MLVYQIRQRKDNLKWVMTSCSDESDHPLYTEHGEQYSTKEEAQDAWDKSDERKRTFPRKEDEAPKERVMTPRFEFDRKHIKKLLELEEINKLYKSGDYSAEMLLQHLMVQFNDLAKMYDTFMLDWAEEDTDVRETCRPHIGIYVDGDSYGVPTMADVVNKTVETLIAKK